jgi:hypothetical protein
LTPLPMGKAGEKSGEMWGRILAEARVSGEFREKRFPC